jgi:transposase, IS30 family
MDPELLANEPMRRNVQHKLIKKWSPQQISKRLMKEFPTSPEIRVSTETIYQAIYVHAHGQLTREPSKQLRRGRSARKPRKQPDVRRSRHVDPMKAISQRRTTTGCRTIPGYLEGDLIIGAAAARPSPPWSSGQAAS